MNIRTLNILVFMASLRIVRAYAPFNIIADRFQQMVASSGNPVHYSLPHGLDLHEVWN
jgi:hypothetical protein